MLPVNSDSKKVLENLQVDPGVDKDPTLVKLPTEMQNTAANADRQRRQTNRPEFDDHRKIWLPEIQKIRDLAKSQVSTSQVDCTICHLYHKNKWHQDLPKKLNRRVKAKLPNLTADGGSAADTVAPRMHANREKKTRKPADSRRPFIQHPIKDQTPPRDKTSKDFEKAAETQRLEDREENAAENNSKSTKKGQQTPPQDKTANDTSEVKRAPQFLTFSALSPHFLSLSGHDTLSKK
ncbi:hypothetical protein DdX_13532 [Ditylenchus destructor]|uniref:Uncharacterized protein n=1 Tax=Ditylenchus destructor TaxID=166010 RepID=A0AAD4QWF6_9BILA|nr:hypothetical protein DdX_13532 [Ditylenchus destructor]